MVVYTVVYDAPHRRDGLSDGIARFRKQADANAFASQRTHYGTPATVDRDDVPNRIAQRWSIN